MVYTASIGSRLGEFDVGRVRDLGLPTIATAPGLAEPVAAKPTKATATPSEPATTKFQLGETLPVVPARIVRRILKGDFVDMAELTEENLEVELRRSLDGEDSKPVPAHKLRPVGDLMGWVRAFCQFAGIVVQSHPGKAVDLWAYLAIVLSGGEKGDWWRAYDSRFRQQVPSLEKAEFGRLDQALYTRCLLSASSSGAQKATQSPSTDSGSAPKLKRRRVTACFAWNDGRACVAIPCRFQHICSRCGGDHKKSACPPTGEGRNPAQ